MKTFNNVVDASREITKAGWARAAMTTDPKLLKKGRFNKIPLPERFDGLKKVTYGSYPIGYEYCGENKGVSKQISASGGCPQDFVVVKASGMHQAEGSKIIYISDKNPEQKYIRLYKKFGKMNAVTKSVYINGLGDIVNISDDDYREYFPSVNPPMKQVLAGVDEDRLILPISPKAENITYLQKGDIVFGEEDRTMVAIIDLIKKLGDGGYSTQD